jgi:hypothetical protein
VVLLAGTVWVAAADRVADPAPGPAITVASARTSVPSRAPSLPAIIAACTFAIAALWTLSGPKPARVGTAPRRVGQGRDPPS